MKRECPLHVVKPEPEPEPVKTPATSKLWQDKKWKYVPASETDLARTFKRIRAEQAKAAKVKGKK